MRALFFVYTPFQFLVAQSIIKQEGFKNSVRGMLETIRIF